MNQIQLQEKRKKLKNVKDILLTPLDIKFDITTLDIVISFIYKESTLRTRKVLSNFYKIFTNLNSYSYEDSPELNHRIWLIKKSLYGRLQEGFENNDILKIYCMDDESCDDRKAEILEDIISSKPLSYNESKVLVKKMDDILEYGYTKTISDVMREILETIDNGDFKSYKSVSDDLYEISNAVINIRRNVSSAGAGQTFSLVEDQFEAVLDDALQKLKDRNRILITGIQRLNTLLSPGYMSKRLYIYLGFPGKGKSTVLFKSAIDIKKYNKGIKTKDPDKRPAVLYLTLENDIAETLERMYNMTIDGEDIRNFTIKQLKKRFREEGQLTLTNEDNIDIIIKEYKNREIDTNDLYSIIKDLSDQGVEVISLILDYIKRIRPAEKANDEKTELKNISNELKEVAKFFDISVISAQQLNRAGASIIDAAMQANKTDLARLIGRDSIAGAWEIIENADWVCIINPELKSDTNELYLTFKLLKRRYRSLEENEKLRRLEYFNQPFEPGNDIRLIDDIFLEKPLALESLATKFEAVDPKRGNVNAVTREKVKTSDTFEDDFEPFDIGKSCY